MKLVVGSVGARGHVHPVTIMVVDPGEPGPCYFNQHSVVMVTVETQNIKN